VNVARIGAGFYRCQGLFCRDFSLGAHFRILGVLFNYRFSDIRTWLQLVAELQQEGLAEKASIEFARSATLNGTKSTPDYVK